MRQPVYPEAMLCQTEGHSGTVRAPWLLTRDFGQLWWSQLISQVGDGATKLALVWFVYSITGSPLKTTIIGLLQTLPPILFGPLVGVCVDRWPKKWIMIGSDVFRALLIGVIPCLVSVDHFTVERLYVLVFLHAIASAVFGPALTAAVPFLVSRRQFTAANALLQTTTSLGVIVGPVLSGVGIAALSSQEVLCVNALTYLGSAACLLSIRLAGEAGPQSRGGPATSVLVDLAEGIRFALIKQQRILLLIVAASLYTFGTSAFSTLFPVFGQKLLNLGPVEVGYFWSAFGVGLLLVSIGLIGVTEWELRNRFRIIAASSALSGAALWGFVWVEQHLAAVVFMGLIGVGVGTLTPIAWGVLQEISPAHMVGRVLAIYTTAAMTTAIAGMTAFGWITETFGERVGVIVIGLVMFATALLAAGLARWVRVRNIPPRTPEIAVWVQAEGLQRRTSDRVGSAASMK
ncbi:MAG: MFS transporter [Nitrospiraceae bacterium]